MKGYLFNKFSFPPVYVSYRVSKKDLRKIEGKRRDEIDGAKMKQMRKEKEKSKKINKQINKQVNK